MQNALFSIDYIGKNIYFSWQSVKILNVSLDEELQNVYSVLILYKVIFFLKLIFSIIDKVNTTSLWSKMAEDTFYILYCRLFVRISSSDAGS